MDPSVGRSMQLGRVVYDETNNRTKISQKVMGVDTQDLVENTQEVYKKYQEPYQIKIDRNTQTKQDLTSFTEKISLLSNIARPMAGLSLYTRSENVFTQKNAESITSDGSPSQQFVQIFASHEAPQGQFKIEIEQLAEYDRRNVIFSAQETPTSPLGLNFSLMLGTTQPNSMVTIDIQPYHSLKDIQFLANRVQDQTGVHVSLFQQQDTLPSDFSLQFIAQDTGHSIVMNQEAASALGIPPSQTDVLGFIQADQTNIALNLSGALKFLVNDTIEIDVAVTPADTLEGLKTKINTALSNASTDFSFQLQEVARNSSLINPNKTYELTLTSPHESDTIRAIPEETDPDLWVGLGMHLQGEKSDNLQAVFRVDGTTFRRRYNKISDSIEGISLNLIRPTSIGQQITTVVSKDTGHIEGQIVELIQNYNEVVDFYQEKSRTRTDPKTKILIPEEDCGLALNPQARQAFAALKNAMGYIAHTPNNRYNSLREIGLTFSEDGKITLTDLKMLNEAIDQHSESLQVFFENNYTTSSSRLHILGVPENIHTQITQGNIQLHIRATSPTETQAEFQWDGKTYPAHISKSSSGNSYTITGAAGSIFEKMGLRFSGTLTEGTSLDMDITIKEGLLGRLCRVAESFTSDEIIGELRDEQNNLIRKGSKKGVLMRALDELDHKSTTLREKITALEKKSDLEVRKLERGFERGYAIMQEFENMSRLLTMMNRGGKE